MGEKPLSVAAARRAGVLAAAAEVWEHELGPMLTSAQVRDLLGGVSRQRVDELLRNRRLVGMLDQGGRRRFPAFQFLDGRPQPPLIDAFWTLADAAVSPWTAAWYVADDDQLDGCSPVRWVRERRDPERLAHRRATGRRASGSVNLTGFPRRTLREDQALHRIPGAARGPWWFSADGSGRFDPRGTGYGACYLAERPMGAWIEVFRKRLLLPEDEVTARVLLSVRLRRAVRLADVTSRRAPGYGVTVSLGSGESYDASQRFATDAIAAGYEGVRYFVRHDPAQKLYGYALFAPAGAPEPDDPLWPAGDDGPIPRELIEEAARLSGYRVLPAP